MLRCVAMIPARFASVRFPGKLLAKMAGKTVLQHTYENARRCRAFQEILIATDDERIREHALSFGASCVMTPSSCVNGTERLAYVLEQEERFSEFDIIFNVQGDEPSFHPKIAAEMLELMEEDLDAVMATAACVVGAEAASTAVVKCVTDLRNNALYFSRALLPGSKSGQFDERLSYYRHLGLYAYRPDFLRLYSELAQTPLSIAEDLEQLKVLEHGFRIKVAIVPSEWHTGDVNLPEDLQKMELALCKNTSSSLEGLSPHWAKD